MTILIVQTDGAKQQSPFDGIRRMDGQGEYWLARDLMGLLGYARWNEFAKVVKRSSISCKNSGNVVPEHFSGTTQRIESRSGRVGEDWRLSRFACYLIAQNGDPEKPQIAAAQSYFAIKTREAEVIIPAQNDRIRELELLAEISRNEKEIATLTDKAQGRQDYRIAAHGLTVTLLLEGKADSVMPPIDRVIETTIDPRSNSAYTGQTLPKIVEHMKKISGTKLKSGADVERRLEQMGEGGLIASRPITIPHKYVPIEHLDTVYELLQQGDQQQLL